ncbi:hypothetical protein LOTGIDRAFT_176615, partial [Lottia gigantea]
MENFRFHFDIISFPRISVIIVCITKQFLYVELTENSFIPTKTGLPTSEWIKRLSDYASGTFLFGLGQRPSTGSRWAKELTTIDNCPRHKSVVKKDLFGNVVQCSCEYQRKDVQKTSRKGCKQCSMGNQCGNERGEILMSVLTTSESVDSLREMAEGLMSRFENSQKDLPKCLYTDRECCNQDGPSKFKVLFSKWTDLKIRLDIWHFMRRLALGCTSESHPLYGTFMSRLSSAIFEWDKTDLANLKAAKKKEIEASGIPNPSESAINKAITKGELE